MPNPHSVPGAPRVDRVELAPADDGLLVRVSGRWEVPPSQPPTALLLVPDPGGGAVQAFAALEATSAAAARAAGPDALRATFSVGFELRAALAGTLTLRIGATDISLPPAEEVEPVGEGGVLDRALVAERRARRAELAEADSARRVLEAERSLAALEGELARLELRLQRADVDRADATLALEQPPAPSGVSPPPATSGREGALADLLRPAQATPVAALRALAAREPTTGLPGAATGPRSQGSRALEERSAALVEALRADVMALRGELGPAVDAEAHAAVAAARTALARADRELLAARELAQAQRAALEAERAARKRWQALALALLSLTRALVPSLEPAQPAPAPARTRRPAPAPPAEPATPWLPRGLAALAETAPASAVGLGLQLVAGQGPPATTQAGYDLHVPPLGRYHVELRDGHATVRPATGRARRGTLVETDAKGLARLLAEGGTKDQLGAGVVTVRGVLRRARALRRIPPAELRLDRLAEVGIWPDPVLVYRALAALIDPAQTRGHRFAVDYEVRGERPAHLHVLVADGAAVGVFDGSAPRAAVRVVTSQRLYQYLLAGAVTPAGERLEIRGDSATLSTLHRWVAAARDGG